MDEAHSETILVVDDEPMILAVVGETLDLAGYTVLKARDGAEALKLCSAQAGPIDLAVLDNLMPQMTGSELLPLLHAICPDMKTILMSGYTEDPSRTAGHQPDTILPKPFLPSQLLEKVKDTLANSSGRP